MATPLSPIPKNLQSIQASVPGRWHNERDLIVSPNSDLPQLNRLIKDKALELFKLGYKMAIEPSSTENDKYQVVIERSSIGPMQSEELHSLSQFIEGMKSRRLDVRKGLRGINEISQNLLKITWLELRSDRNSNNRLYVSSLYGNEIEAFEAAHRMADILSIKLAGKSTPGDIFVIPSNKSPGYWRVIVDANAFENKLNEKINGSTPT